MSLILLNKPFGVLCQFSGGDGRPTLADYVSIAGVYPAGRLDRDSEGLLALTNDGRFQARLSQPGHCWKTYWAQVEGEISAEALDNLRAGVIVAGRTTLPCRARALAEPEVWAREPPIRRRKYIPTSWIELQLREGRNRQVRRMTAAVGFPTLRLIRRVIGPFALDDMQPGAFRTLPMRQAWRLLDGYMAARH